MQIPCQIAFVSFNSKTTGIASETGATYLSEANEFVSGLKLGSYCSIFIFYVLVFADCSVFPLNYTFLLPLRYLQTYFLTKQT